MSLGMAERVSVKEAAVHYFDEHSKLWAGRYSDPGNGEVLWQRHNGILEVIDDWKPAKSSKFLDIGCGVGLLSFDLARRGLQGVGVDGAASMVESCQAEAERTGSSKLWSYQQADAEHLPFEDGSFDAATCCGLIEYLPDDMELLKEVRRVVRPGGHFLLVVTNKHAYAGILSPLVGLAKRIPGMVAFGTALRNRSSGKLTEMMHLPNPPRQHSPSEIRQTLAESGFRFIKDRYCGFTMLPAPFHILFSNLEAKAAPKLQGLDGTRFRRFGSYYIVSSIVE